MVDRLDIMTGSEAAALLGVNRQRVHALYSAGLIRRLARGVYDAQSVLDYKNARDSKPRACDRYGDTIKRYDNKD
jgi:predicted transcriptional regulator of viral defense system